MQKGPRLSIVTDTASAADRLRDIEAEIALILHSYPGLMALRPGRSRTARRLPGRVFVGRLVARRHMN